MSCAARCRRLNPVQRKTPIRKRGAGPHKATGGGGWESLIRTVRGHTIVYFRPAGKHKSDGADPPFHLPSPVRKTLYQPRTTPTVIHFVRERSLMSGRVIDMTTAPSAGVVLLYPGMGISQPGRRYAGMVAGNAGRP